MNEKNLTAKQKFEKKWIGEFKKQKNHIQSLLKEGEIMVQCLDNKSFDGQFYYPSWVTTNYGRTYSLFTKDFMSTKPKDTGRKNKKGEYTGTDYFYIGGKVLSHRLTANYFCDKKAIAIWGESDIEVHHVKEFDSTKGLIANNSADNLCYVPKWVHKYIINKISNGTVPENWDENLSCFIKSFGYHDDTTIKYCIDDSGKELIQFTIKFVSKFFSPAEDELINKHQKMDPSTGFIHIRRASRNDDGSLTVKYDNKNVYQYIASTQTIVPLSVA